MSQAESAPATLGGMSPAESAPATLGGMRILHDAGDWFALDKPSGLAVHRGYTGERDTVVERLRSELGGVVHLGHRLEREREPDAAREGHQDPEQHRPDDTERHHGSALPGLRGDTEGSPRKDPAPFGPVRPRPAAGAVAVV